MKKNKMMRLASGLLVAVLLSTCAISGTFAKYVTEGSGTDSARVAKWGVTVTANGSMFSKTYETKDPDDKPAVGINSVVSSDDDKLVAPGTKGDMVSMTLAGTPEVAVEVTYTVDKFEIGDKWMVFSEGSAVADKFYCPITITVNGTAFCGLNYENANAFEAAVTDAIEAYSKKYEANTPLGDKVNDSLHVSWEWAFTDTTGIVCNQSDADDTILGNRAAAGDAATIELNVTTTVTQID